MASSTRSSPPSTVRESGAAPSRRRRSLVAVRWLRTMGGLTTTAQELLSRDSPACAQQSQRPEVAARESPVSCISLLLLMLLWIGVLRGSK